MTDFDSPKQRRRTASQQHLDNARGENCPSAVPPANRPLAVARTTGNPSQQAEKPCSTFPPTSFKEPRSTRAGGHHPNWTSTVLPGLRDPAPAAMAAVRTDGHQPSCSGASLNAQPLESLTLDSSFLSAPQGWSCEEASVPDCCRGGSGSEGGGAGQGCPKDDAAVDGGKVMTSSALGREAAQSVCGVCGDKADGNFFGAIVCLPCKSFFIRCTKDREATIVQQCHGNCDVTKQLRNRCQFCRFQRCLTVGMTRKEKPEVVLAEEGQALCHVCGDLANGVHFGVVTCEGCKKFFRRGVEEHVSYVCRSFSDCVLNPRNRNNCRYCRYQKCLAAGMSRDAIKMGRPRTNLSKTGPGDPMEMSTTVISAYMKNVSPTSSRPTSDTAPPQVPSLNSTDQHQGDFQPYQSRGQGYLSSPSSGEQCNWTAFSEGSLKTAVSCAATFTSSGSGSGSSAPITVSRPAGQPTLESLPQILLSFADQTGDGDSPPPYSKGETESTVTTIADNSPASFSFLVTSFVAMPPSAATISERRPVQPYNTVHPTPPSVAMISERRPVQPYNTAHPTPPSAAMISERRILQPYNTADPTHFAAANLTSTQKGYADPWPSSSQGSASRPPGLLRGEDIFRTEHRTALSTATTRVNDASFTQQQLDVAEFAGVNPSLTESQVPSLPSSCLRQSSNLLLPRDCTIASTAVSATGSGGTAASLASAQRSFPGSVEGAPVPALMATTVPCSGTCGREDCPFYSRNTDVPGYSKINVYQKAILQKTNTIIQLSAQNFVTASQEERGSSGGRPNCRALDLSASIPTAQAEFQLGSSVVSREPGIRYDSTEDTSRAVKIPRLDNDSVFNHSFGVSVKYSQEDNQSFNKLKAASEDTKDPGHSVSETNNGWRNSFGVCRNVDCVTLDGSQQMSRKHERPDAERVQTHYRPPGTTPSITADVHTPAHPSTSTPQAGEACEQGANAWPNAVDASLSQGPHGKQNPPWSQFSSDIGSSLHSGAGRQSQSSPEEPHPSEMQSQDHRQPARGRDPSVLDGHHGTKERDWRNRGEPYDPYLNKEEMFKVNEVFVSVNTLMEAAEGEETNPWDCLCSYGGAPSEVGMLEDLMQTEYQFSPKQSIHYWKRLASTTGVVSIDREMPAKYRQILASMLKVYTELMAACDHSKFESTETGGSEWPKDGRVKTCWNAVQRRIVRGTQSCIKCAYQVPGMEDVHPNDKNVLVRRDMIFPLGLLNASTVLFDAERKDFKHFFNWNLAQDHPMAMFRQRLVGVGRKIFDLQMDLNEVALIFALNTVCLEQGDFADQDTLERVLHDLVMTLTTYISCVRKMSPKMRMQRLFSMMPRMRMMGVWHGSLMKNMKFDISLTKINMDNIQLDQS